MSGSPGSLGPDRATGRPGPDGRRTRGAASWPGATATGYGDAHDEGGLGLASARRQGAAGRVRRGKHAQRGAQLLRLAWASSRASTASQSIPASWAAAPPALVSRRWCRSRFRDAQARAARCRSRGPPPARGTERRREDLRKQVFRGGAARPAGTGSGTLPGRAAHRAPRSVPAAPPAQRSSRRSDCSRCHNPLMPRSGAKGVASQNRGGRRSGSARARRGGSRPPGASMGGRCPARPGRKPA